jgi:hypothetical protein
VAAWLAAAALVLTRVSYVQVLPIVAAVTWLRSRAEGRGTRGLMLSTTGVLAIVTLLGWVQWVKFGSPLSSGYDQWQAERHQLSWNLWPGLRGFLLDPQWNIWVHFPLLLPALGGYWIVWRRYGAEAIWLAASLVVPIVLMAGLPSWAGEWCYGPRYLLYAMPVAALPAVCAWEQVLRWRGRVGKWLVLGLTAVLLLYSGWLQVQFNRLEFFARYHLRAPLLRLAPDFSQAIAAATAPKVYPGSDYFETRPHSVVVADLIASRGDADMLPFAPAVRAAMSADQWNQYRELTKKLYQRGNLWWATGGKRFVRDSQGNKLY